MAIRDFSGDFLKFDSTQDGDVIEILDEGNEEFNQALNKKLFNIRVKNGEKELKWSPSNEAGKMLQQAFGQDTKDWIGKKFQIFHIQNMMKIRPIKV